MTEDKLERALKGRAPSYEYHLDLSKLVRVERVDPRQGPPRRYAGDLRGWVEDEELEHALTLYDLARRGLRIPEGTSR